MSDYPPLAHLKASSRTACSEIDTIATVVVGITPLPCILSFTTANALPCLSGSDGGYFLIDEVVARNCLRNRSRMTGTACYMPHPSNWDILERSGTVYRSGVYRQMIRSIQDVDRAVVRQMLRWVSYAARPLSALELQDAIGCRSSNNFQESDIEKLSGGLVTVTEARMVRLVHSSVQDYLHSQSGEDNVLGWDTAPGVAHEMITNTCLQHLRSTDLLDSQAFSALAAESDIFHHERRHELYIYARQYWRFHYTRAEHQSYCLPGTLHEKLTDGWRQRDCILASRLPEGCTTTERQIRTAPRSSAAAFLDAALQEGARSGMTRLVKLELEMGATPNGLDSWGHSALHYAAMAGHCFMVRTLLEYGANPHLPSKLGHTPLFHAVSNRHIEAVKLLLNVESSENTHLDPHHMGKAHKWPCPFLQLSLVVSLASCCSSFCTTQSQYVLSKIPNSAEDPEKWPPIHVTGKRAPLPACQLSQIRGNSRFGKEIPISEQRTIVKWFPGISMYTALGIAATSGMDDVLRLLILAGNGKQFLGSNASLNRLMSSLNIS